MTQGSFRETRIVMKIDGKLIASDIKERLKKQVIALRAKKILPHLAVVLVGDDPSSISYIRQKQKVGEEIGVKISIFKFQSAKNTKDTPGVAPTSSAVAFTTSGEGRRDSPGVEGSEKTEIIKNQIIELVKRLNKNPSVHGIIIQRPVPIKIEQEELDKLVAPQKDVDGFHPDSPFTPPVALAVLKILEWVHQDICGSYAENQKIFLEWLKKQKILIIGRGETAGRPIAKTLDKMGINFTVAHSQTTNLKELCLSVDIIITCVGRPHIVRQYMVTSKTILVGVGLHTENGKLQADYNQEAIADKVAYYTPVPGGVGPVNVACLFANLIQATLSFSQTQSPITKTSIPERIKVE